MKAYLEAAWWVAIKALLVALGLGFGLIAGLVIGISTGIIEFKC